MSRDLNLNKRIVQKPTLKTVNLFRKKKPNITEQSIQGANIGLLASVSLFVFYSGWAIFSKSGFWQQLKNLNFIPESVLYPAGGIPLSLLTYVTVIPTLTALANVIHKNRLAKKIPSDRMDNKAFLEAKEIDDVNELFKLTTGTKHPLRMTNKQYVGYLAGLTGFALLNMCYCVVYFDVAGTAVTLLPDFNLSIFKYLNSIAGPISFAMNVSLNQWFAAIVGYSMMTGWKSLKLTKKHFHKKNDAATRNVFNKLVVVAVLSLVSSAAFLFLTMADSSLPKWGKFIRGTATLASIIVYGGVLNCQGALGLVDNASHFWKWLKSMPKPLTETHQKFSKNKPYFLGYLLHNLFQFLKEIAYYIKNNEEFVKNCDLNLPPVSAGETKQLNPKGLNNNNKKREYSPTEINAIKIKTEKKINNTSILQLGKNHSAQTKNLRSWICKERDKFNTERTKPINRFDVWRHGRLRKLLSGGFMLSGMFGLSIMLIGYYFLINRKLAKLEYSKVGLNETDAWSYIFTTTVFLPFMSLIVDAGTGALKGVFNGIEHKVMEGYHSYLIMRRNNKYTSKDFDFEDRLFPANSKEIPLWLLKTGIIVIQFALFAIALPTAGTLLHLLDTSNMLNSWTKIPATFITGLFNSIGATGLVLFMIERPIQYFTNKLTMLQQLDDFTMKLVDGLGRFMLGDLTSGDNANNDKNDKNDKKENDDNNQSSYKSFAVN